VADLTRQQKRDAQEIFAAGKACEHCGALHQRACPRVKRLAVARTGAGDGKWTEAEYWPPGWEQHQEGLIWPEDAFDPEEEAAGDQ
jgi:hypothetical protein